MSFFKELFSSFSNNNSEKPSQNTDILTNSAKRVIPSIADCSYRNTGLNNMTFDELKNLLKNDVFEKKLNRACGNNIAYADMLKKDIVYYYNLMDDLNDHICSILTDRRLLSVDEWMDVFSHLQRKNLIHDIYEAKNSDILDDYKYIYGDDLIRRLESDYTWMYINSSLLLGCVSAIYEKPHFGHDLFDCPCDIVVDEINKACEKWTAFFFKQRAPKVETATKEEVYSQVNNVSRDTTYNQTSTHDVYKTKVEEVKEVDNSVSDDSSYELHSEKVEDNKPKDDFVVKTESILKRCEDDEIVQNSFIGEEDDELVVADSVVKKYEDFDSVENEIIKEEVEEEISELDNYNSATSYDYSYNNVEISEVELSSTYQDTYKQDAYKTEDVYTDYTTNQVQTYEELDNDYEVDTNYSYEQETKTVENTVDYVETVNTVETVDYVEDEPQNNEEHVLSEDAKQAIYQVAQQSFKYTDFSASTYKDFQDFMAKNVFDKKLNRFNGDVLRYTDDLKKNILYYYNLVEDLKYHMNFLMTSKELIDVEKWMSIFGKLQTSNKVENIETTQNADILDSYDEIPVNNLIPSLERDYTWMYLSSNLWLGCIYAIYEYPDFSLALFAEPAGCIVDEFMYECDDIMINWRLGKSTNAVEQMQTV